MKKYLITLFIVFAIIGGAFIAKNSWCNNADELFKANLEALSQEEIIVGSLCMVAPNFACSSAGEVFIDHYPAR